MLELFDICIEFEVNGTRHFLNGNNINDNATCKMSISKTTHGERVLVELIPNTVIKMIRTSLTFKHQVKTDSKLFFNGYQSWTDSQELSVSDKMPALKTWIKPVVSKYQLDKYGDSVIRAFSNKRSEFHGFTYCYIKDKDQLQFLGSIDEKSGFTIFEYSHPLSMWTISKDNQDLHIDQPTTMFDVVSLKGLEHDVFDDYFCLMNIQPRIKNLSTGWTSWYNHYQNISESIVINNLKSYADLPQPIDIFQVDDGYQQAIGDWLLVDHDKFPLGMKYIADEIHQVGIKAGIWLAPFVCVKESHIYKNHMDWLRKDDQGNLLMGGSNWGGFYVLDMEQEAVLDYLKHVFDVVINHWGYDMVKLDFLYAACMVPTKTKTRGQLMAEAMDFLRACVGDKLILGCGVPLASAFGKVDYCRIGCDVGLDWNDKYYMRWFHRERISTYHAINNTIGRSHLNKRAFLNDPDVFILRDESVSLTTTQKKTLATVNKLFGNLLFTSDDLTSYSQDMITMFHWIMNKEEPVILSKTCLRKGVYEVVVQCKQEVRTYIINTTSKSTKHKDGRIRVKPFDCVIMEEQ
jgi:alpha-galactosidase